MGGFVVLFVDDEQEIRDSMGAILRKLGCSVVLAAGGFEALRLAADHPFDLAIVDLMMPGLNGVSTCKLLREAAPAATLVLSSILLHTIAIPPGVIGLPKPYGLKEVRAVLAAVQNSAQDEAAS